ncbi:unnamed protein product [Nippostrongylus brasiliensis]|uniref:Uncharacterized protein n=1 Tax=Nippostrongylus brasiliensis TaxID=27835 RepID=A0A0N4XYC0_NIPBR|nr:unnamed protein product [Nippostrongylus brasiliensis]
MPLNPGFLSDNMDTRVLIGGGVAMANGTSLVGIERSSSDLQSIISSEDDSMGHCHGNYENLEVDPEEVQVMTLSLAVPMISGGARW